MAGLEISTDKVGSGPILDTRQAARTIRELSVATLNELRHMVGVLRAADGRPTEPYPQPGLRDLEKRSAAGGIPTTINVDPRLEGLTAATGGVSHRPGGADQRPQTRARGLRRPCRSGARPTSS